MEELKVKWFEAYGICQNFEMELATIDSKGEEKQIFDWLDKKSNFVRTYAIIGGSKLGAKDKKWYWMRNHKKITYPMKWYPNETGNGTDGKQCLSIAKYDQGTIGFFPVGCNDLQYPFVCETLMNNDIGMDEKF